MKPCETQNVIPEKVMDIRGLQSPLTRSKTKKALNVLGSGKILEIWCTDKEFVKEIEKAKNLEGSKYIGRVQDPEGFIRLYLLKA